MSAVPETFGRAKLSLRWGEYQLSTQFDVGVQATAPEGEPPFAQLDARRAVRTPSGLQYEELRPGIGEPPGATSKVTVRYVGWLTDGMRFDSSFDSKESATFPLNGVIKGWQEGVANMRPGAGGSVPHGGSTRTRLRQGGRRPDQARLDAGVLDRVAGGAVVVGSDGGTEGRRGAAPSLIRGVAAHMYQGAIGEEPPGALRRCRWERQHVLSPGVPLQPLAHVREHLVAAERHQHDLGPAVRSRPGVAACRQGPGTAIDSGRDGQRIGMPDVPVVVPSPIARP